MKVSRMGEFIQLEDDEKTVQVNLMQTTHIVYAKGGDITFFMTSGEKVNVDFSHAADVMDNLRVIHGTGESA